jgi:hypothetical protein
MNGFELRRLAIWIVTSLMPSSAACWFRRPLTINGSTWLSRGVSEP